MTRRNGPKNRKILLFTLTLVMGLTFTTLNQEFLTPHNFLTVAQQTMLYANTSNGYTIQQLYDNKYWYQSSSNYTNISIGNTVSTSNGGS